MTNLPPNILSRLQRFEKTNEMLLNCNALSAGRIKTATDDFKKYTKLVNDMKKDLDQIFKKVRQIKSKINAQYPDALAMVHSHNNHRDDNEEVGVIAEEQMDPESLEKSASTTRRKATEFNTESGTSISNSVQAQATGSGVVNK